APGGGRAWRPRGAPTRLHGGRAPAAPRERARQGRAAPGDRYLRPAAASPRGRAEACAPRRTPPLHGGPALESLREISLPWWGRLGRGSGLLNFAPYTAV